MNDQLFDTRALPASRSRQPAYSPEPRSVTLAYANPLLTIDRGWIRLTLGTGATGSIVLSAGLFPSQHVVIECIENLGTATLPSTEASRVALSSTWTPTALDTLMLGWNGSRWLQLSRAVNA